MRSRIATAPRFWALSWAQTFLATIIVSLSFLWLVNSAGKVEGSIAAGLIGLILVAGLGAIRAVALGPRARFHKRSLDIPELAGLHQRGVRLSRTKRIFDFAIAGLSLIAMLPALALISAAIKVSSAGPILVRQRRVGKDSEVFEYLKFRTTVATVVSLETFRSQLLNFELHPESSVAVLRLRRDPRVTSIGRILRLYGLDELPGMVNVLKGDMSLIGPRPPLPVELLAEPKWAIDRRLVTPGFLSPGWFMANPSDYELALTYQLALAAEVNYARQHSLWLDARLLLEALSGLVAGANESASDLDAIAGFLGSLRPSSARDERDVREIVLRLVEQLA